MLRLYDARLGELQAREGTRYLLLVRGGDAGAEVQELPDAAVATEGTYAPKLIDILANDRHTVAILHCTARHAGKTLDQDYAFILRIKDGQVIEVSEAWTDGAAWNEFWS